MQLNMLDKYIVSSSFIKIVLILIPVITVVLIIAYGFHNDSTELGRNILFYTIIFFSYLGLISLFFWTRYIYTLKKVPENALIDELLKSIDVGYVITTPEGKIEYGTPFSYKIFQFDEKTRKNVSDNNVNLSRVFHKNHEAHKIFYKLLSGTKRGNYQTARLVLRIDKNQPKTVFNISVMPYGDLEDKQNELILWKFQPVGTENGFAGNDIFLLQQAINNLDKSPIGFFSCDYQRQITYSNATFARMTGFDLVDANGRLPNLTSLFSPLVVKKLLLPKADSSDGSFLRIDAQAQNQKNKDTPIELLLITRPIDETAIRHFIAIDKKLLQQELKENRNKYFYKAPLPALQINSKGKITAGNQLFCSLVQTQETQLLRNNISDYLEKKSQMKLRNLTNKIIKQNEDTSSTTLEFIGRIKKNAHFQVIGKIKSKNKQALDKNQLHILIYLSEAQKHPELTVEHHVQNQKMQAIGQLAGGIAHDFNNILTAITGASEMLMNNMLPSSKQFDEVMQIRSNAHRAANLVGHLMAFSRKQKLKFTITSFTEVINSDLLNLIRRLIPAKVELETNLARDLWKVKADINQLEQVIINLAINSRDAMPDGGTLQIKAYNVPYEKSGKINPAMSPGEYVCLKVKDTGFGIPKEVIENIFEPFFTTKETGKGTGMGLATVYGIIRQSGGFIFPKSDGKGATFYIYMPRAKKQESKSETKIIEDKNTTATENKTAIIDDYTGARENVLLVEDEDSVRNITSKALTLQGYVVTETNSGANALKIIDEGKKFDLIISDVLMPGIDGPTLIEKIREKVGIIPTIFISGYPDDALESKLDAKSYTYLAKPFGLKELIKAVKEILHK